MAAIRIGVGVLVMAAVAAVATAQEGSFRLVSNPFQDGFEYRVGEDLQPAVDIEGVRWTLLHVAPKGERNIDAERNVAIVADLEFENTRDRSVTALVVLLLEDEEGAPLERLECDTFHIAGKGVKGERQRFKVSGQVLLATRSVYLFCELE